MIRERRRQKDRQRDIYRERDRKRELLRELERYITLKGGQYFIKFINFITSLKTKNLAKFQELFKSYK